jgi:tetratricopeptide (TPR) repeat protein
MRHRWKIPVLALSAALAACVAIPPAGSPGALSDNAAVLALAEQARTESGEGRLANATATLERALRIEPHNPRLWQALARLRLAQGEYGQAEHLAARANTWAGDDPRLRAENWRLIGAARAARGDNAAAAEAAERARKLER